ncbi:AAA family ATPase, partial [Escherichia coli]|nr:AAA family ATPase [Escherichia coli]
MLTLLGPGGIGKTRLALQFAQAQLAEGRFRDGVFFVALDALSSPEQIPQALVGALSLQTVGKTEPLEAALEFLRERQVLLVLDNFEHL